MNTSSNKRIYIIIFIIILAVIVVGVAIKGQPANEPEEASTIFDTTVKSNPLEAVADNPLQKVKTNPFE